MIDSRPLRFVVAVIALWAGARAWFLSAEHWRARDHASPVLADAMPAHRFPIARAIYTGRTPAELGEARRAPETPRPSGSPEAGPSRALVWRAIAKEKPLDRSQLLLNTNGLSSPSIAPPSRSAESAIIAVTSDPRAPASPKPGKLSGYGWLFVRADGAPGLAGGGQLGGSQAGFRLDYAIARNLVVSSRVSAPLQTRTGREAAIGLGWKPARELPLNITIERRIALGDGGRNAFGIMAAGGIGPVDLPGRFKLEAYGQAGMVGLKRQDGFVDGAATATRNILSRDRIDVALGSGIWGAAQPDLARLDIGPRIRARLDRGASSVGLSLDWRQRIAGDAGPGSALALTLDGSF